VYVPMPDGMRLAVDIWLPAGTSAGTRLPTVLETDRYWHAAATSGGIKNNPNYYIALPVDCTWLCVCVRRHPRYRCLLRDADRRARQPDHR
jgi:predicted acyl esterase